MSHSSRYPRNCYTCLLLFVHESKAWSANRFVVHPASVYRTQDHFNIFITTASTSISSLRCPFHERRCCCKRYLQCLTGFITRNAWFTDFEITPCSNLYRSGNSTPGCRSRSISSTHRPMKEQSYRCDNLEWKQSYRCVLFNG